MQDMYRITGADDIMLATYGLTQVGQLWGKDDITGRVSSNVNAQYPEDMRTNHSYLIDKCNNLRHRLKGWNVYRYNSNGHFLTTHGKIKIIWLI
jgi:hypothetical protein